VDPHPLGDPVALSGAAAVDGKNQRAQPLACRCVVA